MCYGCWEEAGKPKLWSDKVNDAVKAVTALYKVHGAGGGMHIVTDDWNCEDDNVKWCREYMTKDHRSDELEMACLAAFEALTVDERISALAFESGFWGDFQASL